LFNKYPDHHHEQKHVGVCMWYQIRLMETDVWEHRECKDFFEGIPGFHAMDHFDYKIKRDNLGDAYRKAVSARKRANLGIGISVTGITITLIKFAVEMFYG
jgi:hypothetical protein